MTMREVVLCAPVRTAIGTFNGALKDIPATGLGAVAIRETIARAGLDPASVDGVVMGNVIQAGNRMNPARQAAIGAGLPVAAPAMTVNRVCGSGAQAIASAAQEIRLGEADVMVAGGMENMDRAPYLLPNGRWGMRMGDGQVVDSMLLDGLNDAFSGEHSGWHTEDLVAKLQISRADQDAWALRSQTCFSKAQADGTFDDEIVAVEVPGRKGPTSFVRDEHNRPETTVETLAKLRPAFRKDGTITAGNAPGLNSGAAAVIVAERGAAERLGLRPVARLVSAAVAAVEPGLFGLGPVPAVAKALARAGWRAADVERAEVNEAFAAIALAVTRETGLREEAVNPEGGAIAHGHPIGASGAVLTVRLLHGMERAGQRRGLVTLCIGGGQGIALCLERIA
ncbi:acetyl-CoA C-acetyltransferase [Elioraea sp.]|uniref:thiolase family protein n=1 Tax=Elioraea sp. TaxID=2185103 RepID=UPI0025C5E552|nr:acetyl-CoA C-acetyltransferase [Elioraea sp.]